MECHVLVYVMMDFNFISYRSSQWFTDCMISITGISRYTDRRV